jgi:hypothetical protein
MKCGLLQWKASMTDAEFDAMGEWERQEWFEEIHPIMEILLSIKPQTIVAMDPEVLKELSG